MFQIHGIIKSYKKSMTDSGTTVSVSPSFEPALIACIEREGIHEIIPVIIDMEPADPKVLFGVGVTI
jgi:hypothetical protein